MAKKLPMMALCMCILTMVSAGLFRLCGAELFLSLAITFGTCAYHLAIRLAVGAGYLAILKNQADYSRKWYQVSPTENRLYEKLNIKSWKAKLPTYAPDSFDIKKHTPEEIAQAMCQAELVHETNILLSFAPIAAAKWFGALPVFVVTSLLAGAVDLVFVMIQRYNRPRILRLGKKLRRRPQNQ